MRELPRRAAVVIVGGGVMGVSLAYHLATRGLRDVVLLERAVLFGQGATGRCAGGVRHQFATEVNVRLSVESIRMLERFEEELGQPIGLRQCGYLFLLTRPEDVVAFEQNVALQRRLGVQTEWLTAQEVRRRLPLLQHAALAQHRAGLYEVTPDAHPLVGRLEPLRNAYVVAGFSGHGFMHGPIAGKLMAELILDGRASSVDIAALNPGRFGRQVSVREYNVV